MNIRLGAIADFKYYQSVWLKTAQLQFSVLLESHSAAILACVLSPCVLANSVNFCHSVILLPTVQHPDIFLTQLNELFPGSIIQLIRQQSKDLKNPLLSVTELLDKLSKQVPEFASKIRRTMQNVED